MLEPPEPETVWPTAPATEATVPLTGAVMTVPATARWAASTAFWASVTCSSASASCTGLTVGVALGVAASSTNEAGWACTASVEFEELPDALAVAVGLGPPERWPVGEALGLAEAPGLGERL